MKFLRTITDLHHAWATLDSSIAQQFDSLAFIDVTHPLVKVAEDDACSSPYVEAPERVGSVSMPGKTLGHDSRCALVIYRLTITGADPSVTLLPICVTLDSTPHCLDTGDAVLGYLNRATEVMPPPELNIDDVNRVEEAAFHCASLRSEEAERWASETQQARIARQKATMERSYGVRINRKHELLRNARDPRIRRLYEGEVRNLTATLETKLQRLDEAPQPVAKLSLGAVAVVTPV
jgi:hypothetical protein